LATLEELSDTEGAERIKAAGEEYKKGQFVVAERPEDIARALEQD